MIFLINKTDNIHEVIVYESIADLIERVDWQDVFEGKSLIIDESGIEYKWDSTNKNEIGTIHDYTLVPTSRVSELVIECLKRIKSNKNITEFNF